ncbi:hypothetical protein PG999_013125 [Apiospora kogelbergensis]|uniref:Secreted protein n=1 Tax=Apiospora kogelbergensis TaxID=1337665 RepID=A0AAW0QBB3_9PEZI
MGARSQQPPWRLFAVGIGICIGVHRLTRRFGRGLLVFLRHGEGDALSALRCEVGDLGHTTHLVHPANPTTPSHGFGLFLKLLCVNLAVGHVQPPPPTPVQPAHDAVVVLDGRHRGLEGVVCLAAHPARVLGVAHKLGQDVALRLEALHVVAPPKLPVQPQEHNHPLVISVHVLLELRSLVACQVVRVRRSHLLDAPGQELARRKEPMFSPLQLLHPEPLVYGARDAHRSQFPGYGDNSIEKRHVSLEAYVVPTCTFEEHPDLFIISERVSDLGKLPDHLVASRLWVLRVQRLIVGEITPHEDHLQEAETTGLRRLLREVAKRAHNALVDRADDLVLDPPRRLFGLLS